MGSRDRSPSESSSYAQYLFPTGQRRVVTIPSWARNLPPDELSDEEDDPQHHSPVPPRRPSDTRRSLSSTLRNRSSLSAPLSPRTAYGGEFAEKQVPQNGASSSSSPENKAAPVLPAPPQEAHATDAVQRESGGASGGAGPAIDRGWWTFTLPGKYLDRVHGYINPREPAEKGKARETGDTTDPEAQDDHQSLRSVRSRLSWLSRRTSEQDGRNRDLEKQEYHRKMSKSMRLRLAPPNVFSLNQTTTPGWSTPWTPFRREEDARNFQDPFELSRNQAAASSKRSRFENFILHNPFSPLFLRTINLILIVCTLGLAAHIRIQERNNGVIGVMGTSTLFAIVVAPFAIVHIFVTLYIEYFGLPIGLWQIHTKMFHTLTELIFICLYSAILAIVFDDLFTSSLECTSFTPYARYNSPPPITATANVDGSLADSMCNQQIAQVVFIFCSVLFYVAVLVVSLFRIFAKVQRRS